MATRFFFLPWRSAANLGNGGQPRWNSGWDNRPAHDTKGAGDAFWFKLLDAPAMPTYAVTTDPDRVPLVEVAIPGTISYGDPFPHYTPSSYNSMACAYVEAGHPAQYTDARNPCIGFSAIRPFANWVFRLKESGADVNVLSFLYRNSDSEQYLAPYTVNTRLRLDAVNTYPHPMTGVPQYQVVTGRLGPALIYIYRPGVGVVAYIAAGRTTGGYGPGYTFSPGITKSEFPAVGTIKQLHSQLFGFNWIYYGNLSWQDGDLLVWEMWLESQGYYVKDAVLTPSETMSFMVGGGLAGQPLTYTDSVPNWASAWYSKGTFTGYEPSPPVRAQASVGF